MSNISNAEKQERFRKKEALKRRANQAFRELFLCLESWRWKPEEIQYSIDKAIELPSGWTDKDYERAWQNLEQFCTELRFTTHHLPNDVKAGRKSNPEETFDSNFFNSSDPAKYISDEKAAIENVRSLAAHIISALKLSGYSDADQAAALMEVMRFVGRSLANDSKVPRSQAITMCLTSVGPQYHRPNWFSEEFTNILGWKFGEDLAHEVGKRLCKFKNKS